MSVISTISRVGEVPDIASCARIELAKSGTRNCDGEALIVRNPASRLGKSFESFMNDRATDCAQQP